MNRRGIVAMVDAMVFVIVIMMAVSVTVHFSDDPGGDRRDALDLLDDMLSAQVRLSDFTEGDDSLVKASDLMALYVLRGGGEMGGYLTEMMDAFSAGRGYCLTLTFGGSTATLGATQQGSAVSAEAEVPVTTGGTLRAELVLYS